MEEPIFYLDILNSNDLPRHLISMQEPKVTTKGDVIDSTVMHINKGNPHGTQGEPSNPANSDP